MQKADRKTAVGVFDDYRTAERVATALADSGIPWDDIEVRSNFMTGAAGRSSPTAEREGGISGFFHRIFGPHEEEHGHYAEAVRRGSAVVCVTAPDADLDRAVGIMNDNGAVDIDRRVEQYRQMGYQRHDPNAPAYTADEAKRERERYAQSGQKAIPVVEEEMHVGKRAVQRGGVRVYSQSVQQPVEQDVTLREEHVKVERRPVDRPISASEAAAMRDQSVEVTEMAEEPVVEKRARVKEEVVLEKETTERTERVHDTVRHTEVKVDPIGGGRQADYSQDFRRDWEANYKASGGDYSTYQPAYDYGYRMAGDERYRGKSWTDVESNLRSDWDRQYPGSAWDRMKGAVRYGWDRVTGKR